MKMRVIISAGILFAVMLILELCRPVPALAVSTVTASSAGDGVFLVQGIGIEDAAAIEINVRYDTATLANPRVVAGPLIAGAMTAINPNVPGTVRLAVVRLTPVKGSGVIATMTFDRKGDSPGSILSLSARLANIRGTSIPAVAQINNPPAPSTASSNSPQNQQSTSGTTAAGQIIAGTTGTTGTTAISTPSFAVSAQPVQADEGKVTEEKQPATTVQEAQAVAPEKEPVTATHRTDNSPKSGDATAIAKAGTLQIFTQESILEHFQEYKGKRTADAFISLFNRENVIGCRQDPAVAISDGKSTVKVMCASHGNSTSSPDVEVEGGKILSVKKAPHNPDSWIFKVLPDKGAYEAAVSVHLGDLKLIYPLTVAPKIRIKSAQSGKVTKTDFERYLKNRAATKSNGKRSARQDYIDDYIITANYLAVVGASPK